MSGLTTSEGFSVDAVTILIAFALALCLPVVRYARGVRPAVSTAQATIDLLNGSVVFPFVLLVWSAIDKGVLSKLGDARISVALAGGVGLFFVLGEFGKSCTTSPRTSRHQEP